MKIEKIVPGGYGLGFAENMTFFVSLAAPGDRLKVKIYQQKGKTAFAEIVEIVEPSEQRVEPPCIYFGRCGGCDFQQMSYEAQLEAKKGIIKDSLVRIGKIENAPEINVIGSPKPFNYRARAQWHIDTRRKNIGYFRRHSHDVIDVKVCPIITPALQKTLTELRETVEWDSFWDGKVEIESASAGEEVSVYSSELVEPTEELRFDLGDHSYFYDANTFFQGNPFLLQPLIETAISGASGKRAFDLYCGVGLFTLPLAQKFETVSGVEANEKSIGYAQKAVENARVENVSLYAEDVGEWLAQNDSETVDFVLLDPPRAGTEKTVMESLLNIKPREISYVSCDPSTLARDLRRLCEEGGYAIESITAIDLFPQTHHVETVVRLSLNS